MRSIQTKNEIPMRKEIEMPRNIHDEEEFVEFHYMKNMSRETLMERYFETKAYWRSKASNRFVYAGMVTLIAMIAIIGWLGLW